MSSIRRIQIGSPRVPGTLQVGEETFSLSCVVGAPKAVEVVFSSSSCDALPTPTEEEIQIALHREGLNQCRGAVPIFDPRYTTRVEDDSCPFGDVDRLFVKASFRCDSW